MADETEFNKDAAGQFINEYRRETGQLLRFAHVGNSFPDVILKADDGRDVGVEFVSVVLPFINQEHGYFDRYRAAFLGAVLKQRPRYQHVIITLQPHDEHVERARPMWLPAVNSPAGRQLITDFVQLLDEQFETLSTNWGGSDGGALLDQFRTTDGALRYPVLSKYFGAIMFRHMTPQGVAATASSDDPVITNPVVWFRNIEITTAVRRALDTKAAKGDNYSADILVLHTLEKPGIADISGIGMNVDELVKLGQALLQTTPELMARFREIWFLNQYISNGRRLYRLN